jgi:hypothetical protein
MQLFLRQVDMSPFEPLNLGQTASRQEQGSERSNCIFGFGLVHLCSGQCLSKTLQFLRRKEPLALAFGITFDVFARIGVLVPDPPGLGKIHHLRQDAERAVCLIGDMRQGAVKLSNVGRRNRTSALFGKERVEEQFDTTSILGLR